MNSTDRTISSGSVAGKNLLIGVFALQHDCVSREALVAALKIWSSDKSVSLAGILEQWGALNRGTRGLLEQMVELHVAQHGNDPQQSLASVISRGFNLYDLAGIDHADTEATLIGMDPVEMVSMFVPDNVNPENTFVPVSISARAPERPSGSSRRRFHIIR